MRGFFFERILAENEFYRCVWIGAYAKTSEVITKPTIFNLFMISSKITFYFALLAVLIGCKNDNANIAAENNDEVGNSGYAYNIPYPDQWELGDDRNIKIALNSLKAYENGNVSAAFKNYSDTVLIQMDGFEKRMSKDSLLSLFLRERGNVKKLVIVMNDFISLRSNKGKNDYVSLWYKQVWEDANGRVDSIECMDDLAFRKGKIILWNQKVRRYHDSY